MIRFQRHSYVVIAAILGLLCFQATSFADHSWGNYHWKKGTGQVQLNTGDNVTSTWDAYLNEAISDWNPSSVIQLTKVTGAAKGKNCRPTAGRIEVCNASYGNNGWLGIAQIWLSGGHISQATTRVNDTYFNTPQYNTPAWRRLVMCQEIAHDFGLDHQDENFNNPNLGSCMDYTSDPDGPPSNEHPNSHDFAQLQTIYNHVDAASAAASAAPAAMFDIDLATRGQWGKLVHQSKNGRVSLYMLDFGHGHKVFTHVFWAEPRGKTHHE